MAKRRRRKRAMPSTIPLGRPELRAHTSLDDFHNYYWYLSELAAFCRSHGLEASGHKQELVARIEHFLRTGRRPPQSKAPASTGLKTGEQLSQPITLDTPVTAAYRCNAETRAFFKSVIGPHFRFTARMQQYRRQKQRGGIPLTYGDLAREWRREAERRGDPAYRAAIAGAWQYNQFVRDFMTDKARNAGKGMAGAAQAWNRIRVHRGPHTYAEYCRLQGYE